MQPLRQGDVILIPVEQIEGETEALPHLTLALGELTGHSHRISSGTATLLENDGGQRYLEVGDSAILSHEEHGAIAIPPGLWMVRIQREYDPFAPDEWHYVED